MNSEYDHQLLTEHQALNEGRERYLRQQKRLEEDQSYGSRSDVSKIIKGCIPLVSQVLKETLSSSSKDTKRYNTESLSYLSLLDTDLLALIGLQSVFTAISKEQTITATCVASGRMVENEIWALGLEKMDKKLLRRLIKRSMETHGNVAYRRKAIRSTALKEGYKVEPWDSDLRVRVGSPVISAVLEACPEVFEIVDHYAKHETTKYITLTEEASEYIASLTEAEQWMHPKYKPMLVPPRRWQSFWTGCYLSEELSRNVPLVRVMNKEHRDLIREAITDGTMQPCLLALNAIQETAWRINRRMLEIVKWAYDKGVVLDSFPQRFNLEKPTRPDNWDDLDDKQKKAWRIKVSQVAKRNRGLDGERVVFVQDMAVAEELVDREAFWTPCSLDFRGRVYAIPHFNNQRSDYVKALFEFADGLPVGPDGAEWLAIHVANCGDFGKVSKRSFDERVQWTRDNEEMIRNIANDPEGTFDIWSKADKPFLFVAAVLDYVGYLEQGDDYVSHLPIALDGSNSGLQHYSAALRSNEGSLVNLVPTDAPSDVYQVVCDKTIDILLKQAERGDAVSQMILDNGVTRSLVKRNVMTFAYSSELYGFAEQQRDDLMAPLALKVLEGKLDRHPYGVMKVNEKTGAEEYDEGFKASMVLAKAVWAAVTSVVKDASEGMKFFQKCAGALAHERKGLMWVTPVGLPVLHKYTEYEMRKVRLFLFDKSVPIHKATSEDFVKENGVLKSIRAMVRTKPSKHIIKEKAKSAVAPNTIHSLDSAHLMMTVNASVQKGIISFSLIHDSFGTHAANTTEFFYLIREQFVHMYQNYCPFEEIEYFTRRDISDQSKVPPLPTKGDLDLNGVINSLYAFA